MADTLQQNVQVNFQGGGSLPRTLREMLDQTKQLETASKHAAAAGNLAQSAILSGQAKSMGAGLEPFQAADAQGDRARKEELEAHEKQKRSVSTTGAGMFAGGMGAITGLSSLSDPWGLERFQKASADLGAVIGRDLIPYLNAATSIVRFAADAWASLPDPVRSVAAGGIALMTVAGGLIVAHTILSSSIVISTIATVRAAAANMTLAGSAVVLAAAARTSAMWLMRNPLIALAGLAIGAAAINNFSSGSSYGAAVRNVSIGNAESYLQAIQEDVLKAGLSEEEKQTSILQEILDVLSLDPKDQGKGGITGGGWGADIGTTLGGIIGGSIGLLGLGVGVLPGAAGGAVVGRQIGRTFD